MLTLALTGAGLLPGVASAQQSTEILTLYYDSARTQRRAVYRAELRGSRPDTVAHGFFRRFWRSGGLLELGHFTDGQADSVWTRYYPEQKGQAPAVARRLPMRAGKPDGPFVVFHPGGSMAQRGTFRQGQLVDSLVSFTAKREPRLAASFSAGPAALGPTGRFRQWHSPFTTISPVQQDGYSTATDYDGKSYKELANRAASSRYWQGQLGAGRLVDTLTEYDADRQRRGQWVYGPQGQLRFVSSFYPAEWVRAENYLPADTLVACYRAWRWQAVGRQGQYFLQERWTNEGLPIFSCLYAVRKAPPLNPPRCNPVPKRVTEPASTTPAGSAAAASRGVPMTAKPGPVSPTRRYPRPRVRRISSDGVTYQYRVQHPVKPSLRWRLGKSDQLTAPYKPTRHRETRLPDGRRLVETSRTTRVYSAAGPLQSKWRLRWLGRSISRSYHPNGRRKQVIRQGLLGTRRREWKERGGAGEEPTNTDPLLLSAGVAQKAVGKNQITLSPFGFQLRRTRNGNKLALYHRGRDGSFRLVHREAKRPLHRQ